MGACSKFCEFVSALIAVFGAFCLGAIIGWMSPADEKLQRGDFGYKISPRDSFWFGSIMTIGAACVCIPSGFMINIIGRKFAMICSAVPIILGWCLIVFGKSIPIGLAGRFVLGVGGGAFCVSAPVYATEIAELKFRGLFGAMFQFMVTLGILYDFLVGAMIENGNTMTIILGLPSIPLLVLLFFVPFSPVFLIGRGKNEMAEKELKRLRGKDYDIGEEFKAIAAEHQRIKEKQRPLCSTLCSGYRVKALFISIALMFAQQFGGINAFIFFSTQIFKAVNSPLQDKWVTVLLGVVQVIATVVSVFLVDRLGRRILLIISAGLEAISCLVFAVYFLFKDKGDDVSSVSALPVVFLLIYIIGFSVGLGPIPWLMIGELFEDDIKFFAAGISATLNWLFAFIVTSSFDPLKTAAGNGPPFFIFAAVNVLCIVFALFILPETKQKTIQEIQQALGAKE